MSQDLAIRDDKADGQNPMDMTWNLNLWATNDEANYHTILEDAPYTATTAEDTARWLYPNGTPDMDSEDDLDAVDWDEIAEIWSELPQC